MVVRAAHLAALAIEDDQRRSAAPALPARLAERVRRKSGGVDGRGGHGGRLARPRGIRPIASAPWTANGRA